MSTFIEELGKKEHPELEPPEGESEQAQGDQAGGQGALRGMEMRDQVQALRPQKANRDGKLPPPLPKRTSRLPKAQLAKPGSRQPKANRAGKQPPALPKRTSRLPKAQLAKPKAKGRAKQPPALPKRTSRLTQPKATPEPQSQAQEDQQRPALPARGDNAATADRVDEGAAALGMIQQGVQEAGAAYEEHLRTHAKRVADIKKANSKRSVWQKLARKGKQPIPPTPPTYDHQAAAQAVEAAQGRLEEAAASTRAMPKPLPPKSVFKLAGSLVSQAAGKMDGKVEPRHPESARDLSTGLQKGSAAMLDRLLSRGGKVADATLKVDSSMAQNHHVHVYSARYLGMAPVVYKATASDEEGEQQDLLDEGRLGHRLGGSDNVLRTGGSTTRRVGFIMEMLDKGDLAGVADQLKDVPLAEKMEIWKHLMRGGFQGLAGVHDKGLVHGDIKNQNFLLGDDLETKLMDFGTTKEESGEKVGTAAYMAPEVRQQGATTKSDVWSMGESLLLGVLGLNSVDLAAGRTEAPDTRFNEELKKPRELGKTNAQGEAIWLKNIEAKVQGLPDADVFLDFVKKVMAMDPKDRLSAKGALRHEFLALKDAKGNPLRGGNKGKHLLRQRLGA